MSEADLVQQAINYGGVTAVASLALFFMYRLFSNHLAENTKVLQDLKAVLLELKGKLS